MTAEAVKDEAFLVLTPTWSRYRPRGGEPNLEGFRISRLTRSRPSQISGDELVMKVRIQVPARAFRPLAPEVVIDVPESQLMTGEAILASALDPAAE